MKKPSTQVFLFVLGVVAVLAILMVAGSTKSTAHPSSQMVCAPAQGFPAAGGPGTIAGNSATCPAGMHITGGTCENSGGVLWSLHGTTTNGTNNSITCAWGSLTATPAGAAYNACALCEPD